MDGFFNSISDFDWGVLDWIHKVFSCGFLDTVFPACALLLGIIVWAVAAIALTIIKKTRLSGIAMLIACTVTFLLAQVFLKHAIMRDRPLVLLDPAIFNVSSQGGSSFPSAHTALAFTGAAVLACFHKKFAWIGYLVAFIVAFSRLYLYAHFPSDVIAGIIIGTVVGVVTSIVTKNIAKKPKNNKSRQKS